MAIGKLKIENENLQEIVQKMERWYGIKIQLHDVPENKRYWMTIKQNLCERCLRSLIG